jgi:uncharacterized protein YndB with AHSA1/START domain
MQANAAQQNCLTTKFKNMTKKMTGAADTSDREIVLSRTFDAPRDLVFKVWTDPNHLVKWWGPEGFTNTNLEMDFRPGGVWRFIMHAPDGTDFPNRIVFNEIVKPERLTYTHSNDGDGPVEVTFEVEIIFEQVGKKTKLTMRSILDSAETLEMLNRDFGATEGAIQHLARLETYLTTMSSDKEILITRTYDAPRELVFKVWTDPDHLRNWYAPEGCEIRISRFDFRPGGEFLHCIYNEKVKDCWCVGTFREIVQPEKIVYELNVADKNGNLVNPTDAGFDPEWPATTTVTVTFESIGDKTRITLHQSVSENLAKRTGAYPSWLSMLDKLENELAKMALIP